jgi:hypothetical protein
MLLLIPTTIAVWANTQLLNTNNVSVTVSKVIVLPGVKDTIADGLTNGIVEGATLSDLAQAILPADQQGLDEVTQKAEIKKVVKSEIVRIISSQNFTNLIQSEVQKALNTVFDIANNKNTDGVINFNPLVVGVINSTKGTKIAIISDKLVLADNTGVVTLTQQNIKDIKTYINNIKTTMALELVAIVICLLLAVLLANNRLNALKRLALAGGIIYVVYGLILILVPMLISPLIKDSQAMGVFEAVRSIINPLAYFSLIAGIILIVAVVITNIVIKSSSKSKPAVEEHKTEAKSVKENKEEENNAEANN